MKNRLILGDNLKVMKDLPVNSIDLCYADPPYGTGRDFGTFDDRWGSFDDYLSYIAKRLTLIDKVLKPSGSFYLQCDANACHSLKVMCDEILEYLSFKRQIIWQVTSNVSGQKTTADNWIRNHDVILFYAGEGAVFNKQYLPYPKDYWQVDKETGQKFRWRYRNGVKEKEYPKLGLNIGDVWTDIPSFQASANLPEYLGYPTQKPEALLKRIILSSSEAGQVVLDPFCGSGTTLVVAERLNRKFVGIDASPKAYQVAKDRLASNQIQLPMSA